MCQTSYWSYEEDVFNWQSCDSDILLPESTTLDANAFTHPASNKKKTIFCWIFQDFITQCDKSSSRLVDTFYVTQVVRYHRFLIPVSHYTGLAGRTFNRQGSHPSSSERNQFYSLLCACNNAILTRLRLLRCCGRWISTTRSSLAYSEKPPMPDFRHPEQ